MKKYIFCITALWTLCSQATVTLTEERIKIIPEEQRVALNHNIKKEIQTLESLIRYLEQDKAIKGTLIELKKSINERFELLDKAISQAKKKRTIPQFVEQMDEENKEVLLEKIPDISTAASFPLKIELNKKERIKKFKKDIKKLHENQAILSAHLTRGSKAQ